MTYLPCDTKRTKEGGKRVLSSPNGYWEKRRMGGERKDFIPQNANE
jgi:hypothetical protein